MSIEDRVRAGVAQIVVEQNISLMDDNDRLRAALSDALDWMEDLRASGDAGFWDWQDGDDYTIGRDALRGKVPTVDEERARICQAIRGADRAALRAVASQLGLTPREHSEDAGQPYVAPVDQEHDI